MSYLYFLLCLAVTTVVRAEISPNHFNGFSHSAYVRAVIPCSVDSPLKNSSITSSLTFLARISTGEGAHRWRQGFVGLVWTVYWAHIGSSSRDLVHRLSCNREV